jgi:hypothetical protein
MTITSVITYRKIIWLILLVLIISIYFFLFPQKHYFNCSETSWLADGKITQYDLKTNNKISEQRYRGDEDVMVKKYYFGLFYALDNYDVSDCGVAFDKAVVCTRAYFANPKSTDYTEFDLIKSTLNKTWFSVDPNKQTISEYDLNNMTCKKITPALN